MEKLTFRKASESDAEKIHKNLELCSNQMYNEHGLTHWIPVYPIDKIVDDIKSKEVYVVELDGIIVGNFILSNQKSSFWSDNCKSIYLSKLAVIPEYSGLGIGRRCMEYIEQMAKIKKYDFVRFDVYNKSINTIKFYEKLDYKTIGEAKTRRFVVLLMEKRV
ncbi:MAG: GNAT family N-acetyltransferase [Clostridia bacterium]|nr:GNAT family N-acetyltransferase [Clostridia bacterium]